MLPTVSATAPIDAWSANPLTQGAIKKVIPEKLYPIYNYLMEPEANLDSQLVGLVAGMDPAMGEAINGVTNPTGVLKQKMFQELIYDGVSSDVQTAIQNAYEYGDYAENVLKYSEETGWGRMQCDVKGGTYNSCEIKDKADKDFIEVTDSFSMNYDEEGDSLTFTNEGEEESELRIGDFRVVGIPWGANVTFSRDEDGNDFLEVGAGTLRIGDDLFFHRVEDAKFQISKDENGEFKQIEFAAFTAEKPAAYAFQYDYGEGQRTYSLQTTEPNSRVLFAPEVGEIVAENVVMISGTKEFSSSSGEILLNERGDFSEIHLAMDGKYEDSRWNLTISKALGEEVRGIDLYFDRGLPDEPPRGAVSMINTANGLRLNSAGGVEYKIVGEYEEKKGKKVINVWPTHRRYVDGGNGKNSMSLLLTGKGKDYLACGVECLVSKNGNEMLLEENGFGEPQNVKFKSQSLRSTSYADGTELFVKLDEDLEGNSVYATMDPEGRYNENVDGSKISTGIKQDIDVEIPEEDLIYPDAGNVGKVNAKEMLPIPDYFLNEDIPLSYCAKRSSSGECLKCEVEGKSISRCFGVRRGYNEETGETKWHVGVDLALSETHDGMMGNFVPAMEDGIVTRVSHFTGGTCMVLVYHPSLKQTFNYGEIGQCYKGTKDPKGRYGPIKDSIFVKRGDKVVKGMALAPVFKQNRDAMVHLEIYEGNRAGNIKWSAKGDGAKMPDMPKGIVDPTEYIRKYRENRGVIPGILFEDKGDPSKGINYE